MFLSSFLILWLSSLLSPSVNTTEMFQQLHFMFIKFSNFFLHIPITFYLLILTLKHCATGLMIYSQIQSIQLLQVYLRDPDFAFLLVLSSCCHLKIHYPKSFSVTQFLELNIQHLDTLFLEYILFTIGFSLKNLLSKAGY